VKTAATTPIQLVEDFYDECQGIGVSNSFVRNAIDQSSEWYRKWVLQEEDGHTMLHDRYQWSNEIDDFRSGARNPALSSGENSPQPEELPTIQSMGSTPILCPIALRPQDAAPSPLNMPCKVELSSQSSLTLPSEGQYPPTIDDLSFNPSIPSVIIPMFSLTVENAKENLLHALAVTGGDVKSKIFEEALLPLVHFYGEVGWDARDPKGIYSYHDNTRRIEGRWLTLSKPTYSGNLGQSASGDPMYTLGRMAFDMFLPTQLVCSLQGNFNPVIVVPSDVRAELTERCPKRLKDEICNGSAVLREYNIVTAFTVESHLADFPKAPNKNVRRSIKGIMTTYGYVLPDPQVPNRLSIWFTGGRIEPNDDVHDQREWKRLFSRDLPERDLGEKIRLLAASLLMGAQVPTSMNKDGSMSFTFTRPLGGHGVAYVDVIYLDNTIRVVRGHHGTIFTFVRIPENRS